ncbi:glycoside hydrolase 15 protein [Stygiomarasmius scandens]|uniref:Glucoamylase n=1 Tax=Marasmiellus scandens TaxID=2682957 RepID=A0ABR1JZ51_9AGAR
MPQQAKGTNGTVTILTLLVLGIGLSWTYFRIPDSYLPVLENARVLISDNSIVAQSGLASMVQKLIGTKYMSVDEYIAFEGPIARAGVLANIGPDGKKVPGALPGVVVASPSTSDPDYFYTWTRDSALVFKMLVDQFIHNDETDLKHHLDNYVSSQKILQQVSNPSGDFGNGGLAEPKFHCNLTAFEEPWGRPQRDGPALRATTLIAYGNAIVDSEISYVKQSLWPVIKADLHYVAEYWNKTGFDLWEEVSSRSFFTTAVHHRALREGSTFASRIGETAQVQLYNEQADNILCFLQSYWNPSRAFMTSNTGGGRSGIDANSVLASIHTFDPAAGCDPITFQPCSDKALSNLKVYVDSFRSIYPVNSGIPEDAAVATGRYSEDIYFEGNPWYLTTFAVAEQLYDALVIWKKQKYLEITPLSLEFFRQLLPNIQTGKYGDSTDVFNSVSSAVRNYADGFISVNAKFTPRGGNLAEQFNRTTGEPVSARDLTWSYAAAVTAFRARVGFVPDSWGAKGLKVVTGKDKQCVANPGPSSRINFKVKVDVNAGEHVFLTGSVDELKSWNPDEAVPLSRDGDTTWSIQISVPANTMIQYKYIRKSNGSLMWESDPNHHTKSPAEGGSTVVIDTWQG